jgi:hypothetical protein
MKDHEVTILRFLTEPDEWVDADTHAMVPTKPKPASEPAERRWPERLGCVCRKTKMGDGSPLYPDCYVCDKPLRDGKGVAIRRAPRTWALAVLREAVLGDGSTAQGGPGMKGKRIGFRTLTREQAVLDDKGKPTSEIEVVPALVVVNQGWKNFFSTLSGAAKVHGTLLDRDFWIVRNGADQTTTYQITPLDPVSGFDMRDPAQAAKMGLIIDPTKSSEGDFNPQTEEWEYRIVEWPDMYALDDIVFGQASDEYFARFIDPNKTPAPRDAVPGEAIVSKPNVEVTASALANLADRVKGYAPVAVDANEGTDAAPSATVPMMNFG